MLHRAARYEVALTEGQQNLNLILVLEATIHRSRGVLRVKLIYGLARTIVRRRQPAADTASIVRTNPSTSASPKRTLDHHSAGPARQTAKLT